MYTSSDGDFFAWLAKKKHSRQPLESLIFEKPTSNLDTFVKEMDAAHLTDISYFPNSVREANDTVLYFSISCLPRYDAYSSEELRLYDYLQGRTMALCPPPVEIPPLKDSVMAESGIDRVSLFNFV
ncbi:hypothetical protein BDN72DRAFT_961153 [Pluteus cervinus]|uniref:Uncharacterized protein n=1 Tax=Pluteus cervinus TaxID=181527 RepID=A0ACD3AMT8_9AGAR|nr:hypothetical protein BDN72DRAFT_961153 [Pluteus cervinus]